MTINEIKKNTAVIGFGKTGKAVLDFLLQDRNGKKLIYLYNDTPIEDREEQKRYEKKGVTFLVGENRFGQLAGVQLVILSPGVNGRTKRFDMLRQKGIETVSEIEFASWFLEASIIAVTGTNGKSTTVSLIHHILKHSGIKSFLAGNIGTPFISEAAKISKDSVVVLELSSFQLEEIDRFKPDIGVLLNITPDHLDRYASMEEYFSAKLNLVKNQDSGDYLVLNYDDPVLRKSGDLFGKAQRVWFSRDRQHGGAAQAVSLAGNPLRGEHNLENLLAAVTAAGLAGAAPAKIEAALPHFKGLPHRMESLGKINGVEFINDSKATNVDAAIKSINSIAEPLVVILGGKDKGGDFSILEKALKKRLDTVEGLLLIGQAGDTIRGQMKDLEEKFHTVKDLGEAAAEGYRRLREKGGVVLLAPGCASFDMFNNFEHRGDVFKEEFLQLKGGGNHG